MKYLTYTLFALLCSANIYAIEIPNQFEDGQVTSASQMNENFQALKAELEAQRALIEANLGNQKVVFQGFSAETMNGAAGLLAMQQACHNLVAGSHVCKDTEIALSPYNPSAQNLEGSAWLISEQHPTTAGVTDAYNGYGRRIQSSPLSLFQSIGNLNMDGLSRGCDGWGSTSSSKYGGTVNSVLNFDTRTCNTQQKVACCK
jgi:hypothetical protein